MLEIIYISLYFYDLAR